MVYKYIYIYLYLLLFLIFELFQQQKKKIMKITIKNYYL